MDGQSTEQGTAKWLDAHMRPPKELRDLYKKFHSATELEMTDLIDSDILRGSIRNDFKLLAVSSSSSPMAEAQSSPSSRLAEAPSCPNLSAVSSPSVYACCALQGLQFIPELLSPKEQVSLLSKLLHRDLADPRHQTNLHMHYRVPYELTGAGFQENGPRGRTGRPTFFNTPPTSPHLLQPKDPSTHKPLTVQQALDRKLRWITLGGQYDWTRKRYPDTEPPAFPEDLKTMIQSSFPDMVPEAAIINIYTPGDTLSLHRDVSEVSDRGLVSISLGCDGIFMAGLEDGEQSAHATFRLRSGDAIYMGGASRYAWHGVPRILRGTCPAFLESWPADPITAGESSKASEFEPWRGWMKNKRVNLNVRQMFPRDHGKEP